MIVLSIRDKKHKIIKKRARKLYSMTQNNYFLVKIGFKIFTTIVTITVFIRKFISFTILHFLLNVNQLIFQFSLKLFLFLKVQWLEVNQDRVFGQKRLHG
jgi:hypothetical protein